MSRVFDISFCEAMSSRTSLHGILWEWKCTGVYPGACWRPAAPSDCRGSVRRASRWGRLLFALTGHRNARRLKAIPRPVCRRRENSGARGLTAKPSAARTLRSYPWNRCGCSWGRSWCRRKTPSGRRRTCRSWKSMAETRAAWTEKFGGIRKAPRQKSQRDFCRGAFPNRRCPCQREA